MTNRLKAILLVCIMAGLCLAATGVVVLATTVAVSKPTLYIRASGGPYNVGLYVEGCLVLVDKYDSRTGANDIGEVLVCGGN